jgi:zinc transport system permease protein
MTWDLLADPVFRLPFLADLLVAGVLPALGALLICCGRNG